MLHLAAAAGYHVARKALLKGKADRSTMNHRRKTALELAEEKWEKFSCEGSEGVGMKVHASIC